MTLLRQVRAAGFDLTAVIGDAEFGEVTLLRAGAASPALALCIGSLVDVDGVSTPSTVGGVPAARWRTRTAAIRVTPATGWRVGRLAPEVWLLCEQESDGAIKHYLVNLPATTALRRLVALAHQRWAIEQQYQELKSELGLDHFEGRTYPGWQHYVVLTAVAHAPPTSSSDPQPSSRCCAACRR